jgi:integrase
LKVERQEYAIRDTQLLGFGVRVRPTGAMSYDVVYRAGAGRGAKMRRFTIARVGQITPEIARRRARAILADVAHGKDPAADKMTERNMLTVAELADRFMAEHVKPKRKTGTAATYRYVIESVVKAHLGTTKADKLTPAAVARMQNALQGTPSWANRAVAVVSSMYGFAARIGIVTKNVNPASKIGKYSERNRERFLTGDELERLGATIREAETIGIPWQVDETAPKAKHAAKQGNRFTVLSPFATAALRLLLFTGCRLREILHLKWEHVDIERGVLFLPDSKTGRKTVVLNAPALAVLAVLPRRGSYVVPGDDPESPRADLKRPWRAIAMRAGLSSVRLHDLRHTYASFGAGGGLGLPIIGKLLGHAQAATTARYAHLDNDPLRRASESIAGRIAAAMGEAPKGTPGDVIVMRKPAG